jgi:hypothetical protein
MPHRLRAYACFDYSVSLWWFSVRSILAVGSGGADRSKGGNKCPPWVRVETAENILFALPESKRLCDFRTDFTFDVDGSER